MSIQKRIKLTYFDMGGRAEEIRYAFLLGGVKYEDHRISFDEWATLKTSGKIKFEQIPVLEIGNRQYAQSQAIARYAAVVAGIYPFDPILQIKTEQALITVHEFRDAVVATMGINDPSEQKAARQKLATEYFPSRLPQLEKIVEETGTGYFVNDKIGIAELSFHQLYTLITSGAVDNLPTNIFDRYPKLKNLESKVANNKKIKEYDNAHK